MKSLLFGLSKVNWFPFVPGPKAICVFCIANKKWCATCSFSKIIKELLAENHSFLATLEKQEITRRTLKKTKAVWLTFL
jgi:hypothetical protein